MNKSNTSDEMKNPLKDTNYWTYIRRKKFSWIALYLWKQLISQLKTFCSGNFESRWLHTGGSHHRAYTTTLTKQRSKCFPARLWAASQTKASEPSRKTPRTNVPYNRDEKTLNTTLPNHIQVFIKKGKAHWRLSQECKVV